MRGLVAVVFMMIACGDDAPRVVDGGIDALPPEFLGEPCGLPSIPGALSPCHCDRVDPNDGHCYGAKGWCVDEGEQDGVGICRPFCDQPEPTTRACLGPREGGIPTWTSEGAPPYVCYCRPG